MQQQRKQKLIQQEGRIILTLQAYAKGQFQSVQHAAAAFNVRY
jgi:hypothetical protein